MKEKYLEILESREAANQPFVKYLESKKEILSVTKLKKRILSEKMTPGFLISFLPEKILDLLFSASDLAEREMLNYNMNNLELSKNFFLINSHRDLSEDLKKKIFTGLSVRVLLTGWQFPTPAASLK
jgi:hypothetical protein